MNVHQSNGESGIRHNTLKIARSDNGWTVTDPLGNSRQWEQRNGRLVPAGGGGNIVLIPDDGKLVLKIAGAVLHTYTKVAPSTSSPPPPMSQ